MDADDTIETTYVEKAVNILDKNPDIGIVYCKARRFGYEEKEWDLPEFNKTDILFSNCIFNSALYRKKDFYRAGKYKEYMKYGCEDWDLWLSFIELGLDVYRIDEILFNYRKYGNEISHRGAACIENIENVYENIGLNHARLYFSNKECRKRIFHPIKDNSEEYNNKYKKYKKYKKLFNFFLFSAIIQLLVIFVLLSGGC